MAVPLLSLVISPLQAAAIMLPILCFIDLFGLRAFRGVYDRRNMPILLTGLAIGVVVGSLIFGLVRQDVLRLVDRRPLRSRSRSTISSAGQRTGRRPKPRGRAACSGRRFRGSPAFSRTPARHR